MKATGTLAALLAVGLIVMLGGVASAAIEDNLISYWDFDGTLTDSHGGHNGTYRTDSTIGTATYAAGKLGTGVVLDRTGGGSNVDYRVQIDDESAYDFGAGATGMSISAWFQVDAFNTDWQALIAKGEGNEFRVHRQGGDQRLAWNAGGGGDLDSGYDVNDGAFHHLVVTHDGVNRKEVWVDGQMRNSSTNGSQIGDNDEPLMIGDNPDAKGRVWDGVIDDVAIWSRALTSTEIAEIWNGGTGATIPSLMVPVQTWDGAADGDWSASARWTGPKPPNYPDATVKAEIGPLGSNNSVTVATDQAAHTLTLTGNAELTLGPGTATDANELNVKHALNAAGRSVTLNNYSKLKAGGGAVGEINVQPGTATVEVAAGGTFTVDSLFMEDWVGNPTLVKAGAGLLTVTADVPNVLDPGATLQVDDGEVRMESASNPMRSGALTLNGGLFTAKGPVTTTNDAIRHYGYHINNDGLAMDLNDNGGMMGGGDPTSFQNFNAAVNLTDGPGSRGLDFDDDNDFITSGAIGQNDNYSNLWLATLHVSAAEAGNWEFQRTQQDDATGMWLDLDQDGVFESSVAGLGSDRGEQLAWGDGGTKTVNLPEGDYLIGFTHREGGGGSQAEFQFKSPTMGAQTVIKPADGAQAGLWSHDVVGDVDMTDTDITVTAGVPPTGDPISGLRALTPGSAVFGNLTFRGGTELVTSGADMDFTSIAAPDAGSATLTTQNNVTTNNFSDGGTATAFNKAGPGMLTLGSSGSLSAADTTFDVKAGTLATKGASPLGGSDNMVLSGGTWDVTGGVTVAPGIDETIFDGTIANAQDNIEAFRAAAQSIGTSDGQGILTSHLHYDNDAAVSARAAALGAVGFDNGNFAMLWTTDFTPDEDGAWGFRFAHEDDNASLWIDSDQNGTFELANRFYNRGCCDASGDQFTVGLTSGQTYKLGIVMNDGGGGGDFRDMEFKAPSGGWVDLNPGASSLLTTKVTSEINLPDLNIDVTADSRLQANSDVGATFGHLTVQDGAALTTGGTAPGITFNETILPTGSSPAAEDMVVTFKPEVPTTLTGTGPLVNNSSGPDTVRVVAAGTSDLILDKAPTPGALANVTFEARSGRLMVQYGSDPTDGAPVVMTGGTFAVKGATVDGLGNGISGSIFQGTADNETPVNLDGANYQAVMGRVFTGTKAGTILVAGTEDANNNVIVTGSTQNWDAFPNFDGNADHFVTAYSGQFTPRVSGVHNFHWNNDDRGLMYIDLDNNGTFESSERVAEYEWDRNGDVNLNAGQAYNAIYMAQEWTGGQGVWLAMTEPGGGEAIVNPSDGRGTWKTLTRVIGSVDIRNTITVDNQSSNGLRHLGYHINNDGLAMDLNNNGGMMGGGDPTTFQNFFGEAMLVDGPGGRGLDFNDDGDFTDTGAIGQNDNYSNLWMGMLHVSAAEAGDWEFQRTQQDDATGMWLDLDQDGVFESSAPGLGSDRGEQLAWGDGGTKTVSLAEGDYMIGFTHREGGGGSQAEFQFKSPSMGGQAVIKPGDAAQAGLWSVTPTSTLELITDLDANLKELVLKNGDLRITGGNLLTIEQASISSATSGKVGLITDTDTILTQVAGFDGNGQTATLTKGGTADLIMNKAGTGLDDVTFSVKGGRLIGVHASNPFGAADIVLDGGGVVLSSAGGDVTYDNAVTVKSESTLTAGAGGGGAPGPLDVTLGNATTGIALNGGVLTARTTDGYRLVVPGPVTGPGGIDFAGGSVKTEQGVSAGSVALSGATLETPADVTATGSLSLKGGTLRSSGIVNVTGSTVSISGKPNLEVQSGHLTIPAPMGTAVLPGTLGAWSFNGDSAADSSGNGYDGVKSGGSYSSDVPPALAGGRSVDLGGNGYISVDDGAGQSVFDLDELSVAFWTKGWPSSDWGQHVSKRGEGGQGWAVRRNGGSGDQISWTLRGPGNDDWNAVSTVNDGDWHHVVATYGDGKRRLYQDGVLIGEEDRSGGINDAPGYLLVFGARDDGGIANFANVRLDDVYILDRVIDASEVADLYNNNLLPEVAAFGDLTMAAGTELTLAADATASFENISAGDGAQIHGDVETKSSVTVGSSVGTLNIDGDYTQGAGSTYKWEADTGAADTIAATGHVDASADWNLEVTPLSHNADMGNTVLISGGSADAPGTVTITMPDNVYSDLYDLDFATVAKSGNNIVLDGVGTVDMTTSYGGTWPTSGSWDNGVPNTSKAAVVAGGTVTSTGGAAKDLVVAGGDLHHNANTLAVSNNVRIGAGSELKVSGPTTTVTVGNEAKVYNGGTLHLENGGTLGSTVKILGGGTLKTSGDMDMQDNVEFDPTGNLHVATGTLRVAGGGSLPTGDVLHLKADDLALGDGAPVASWADASPSGIIVAQGDTGRQPIYQASVASLGGQPAVWFDADALSTTNSTGITGDHDLTVVTVWSNAQGTGQNYQHTLHMGNTGTREAYGHSVSRGGNNGEIGNHYWGDGWNSSSTDGLGNPIIALSTYDSATDQDTWWVNGNPVGFRDLASDGGLNIGGNQLHIGSRLDPSTEGIRGNVAEVLVFDRVLTPDEMNAVGGYLADKYSIGTTYDGGLGTKFGNLVVDSGATLLNTGTGTLRFTDVSGGGTVDSDVKIGGQASPGDSSGTLNVTGDLVLADGASYLWELGARGYDSILVGGDLAFDGDWTLALADAGGTASPDDMFYLFDGSFPTIDLDTITPMVDFSMVDPARWDPSSLTFGVDNRGVFMTGLRVGDIPEPATMAMLGMALAGLGGYIRRRRRA